MCKYQDTVDKRCKYQDSDRGTGIRMVTNKYIKVLLAKHLKTEVHIETFSQNV